MGYSIFACVLWPSIHIAVGDKNLAGFSYGISSGFQNIGMSINPMIIAQILVKYKSYFYCLIFLMAMSCVSILTSGYLYYINNTKYNFILNRINYEDENKDEKKNNINIEMPNIQNNNKNYDELIEEN